MIRKKSKTTPQIVGQTYVALGLFAGVAVFGQNPSQFEPTPQLGQVYPQSKSAPGSKAQPNFKMNGPNSGGPASSSPPSVSPAQSTDPTNQPVTADDLGGPQGAPVTGNEPGGGPEAALNQPLGISEDLAVLEAKRMTAEFDRAAGKGAQSGPPADLLEGLRTISLRATPAGSWARRTLVRLLLGKGGGGPAAAEDFISRAPAESTRELYYYYARQLSRQNPGRAAAALDRILARPERDRFYVLAGVLQLRLNLRLGLMERARNNYLRLLQLEADRSQSEAKLEQMGLLDDFYYWAARYHLAPGSTQNIRLALDYLRPFEDDPVRESRTAFTNSIWAPDAVRLRRQMAALYSIGRM